MSLNDLPKAYAPADFEDRIYQAWHASTAFQPKTAASTTSSKPKKPFVVVMPPPNVTGVLHMGHALNNALPDILVRYHRMTGRPVLWVPGTDHAGIATQHVVEKKLRAKGVERRELGREKFVEETWKVKHEHHAIIKKQLEKIGCSCDWSRERFTLDEGLSRAVREVFVSLHERKLIYRGKYLVNWCSRCGTALADDEVDHEDTKGAMYHIRYEYADGSGSIEIATTRPETLLGDVAVAAHPDDERYKSAIGKQLKLPLSDRLIPLIADAYVDKEFGTGLVKITPAHDPNDFEVGNRHNLERINILRPDGMLNDEVPAPYRGLTVKDARALVVQHLKDQGLFVDEKPVQHSVGHCYRCNTVVEPYLSEQWFVKMKPLADKALQAWKDGDVRFHPQRWENTYSNWLTNIRDWCISRQLWWGHRIPVWYCRHCGLVMVEREEPVICPKCQSTDIYQDPDVLDTWFSSWLWPFSVMGWPKDTADLKKYYPTSVLLTGYDIIFFWVARMIMAGMEFMGQAPFRDVCITTLVRDKQGRKMSKSLGNGIDPLEIVQEYGADALRFTLAFMFTPGQDILMNKDDFKLGSKFCNKVWNASRYILMNLEDWQSVATPELTELDRWIRHRCNECSRQVADALGSYRFNDAAAAVYEFFWNDFCDWYVEASKLSTRSDSRQEKNRALTVLLDLLERSLRLLHPFIPFVTEEIHSKLPGSTTLLVASEWPVYDETLSNPELDARFGTLKEIVTHVRTLRSEFGIAPERKLRIALRLDSELDSKLFIRSSTDLVRLLVNAESVEFAEGKPESALALAGRGYDVYIYAGEAVDLAVLGQRFRKEAEKDRQYIERTAIKLDNPGFISSAPEAVVAHERAKLGEAREHLAKLETYIAELSRE